MSAKLKHFINCYVPTEYCNFRCEYCYITLKKKFEGKIYHPKYPMDYLRRALRKERFGGMCLFNLCAGGETLLAPDIIPFIKMLLEEGHNVAIVTNGTVTENINRILSFDKSLFTWLYFKFSFHYEELKRLHLMEQYFKNIQRIRENHISFSVDIVPYDGLIPYIGEIKKLFMENLGALPHITVGRDSTTNELKMLTALSEEDFYETWKVFESPKFEYKISEFSHPHKEFCYAGDISFSLQIATGNLRKCDGSSEPKKMNFYNIYENPTEEIPFRPIGRNCPLPHCFNCHALLTLGTIPELKTPSYAEMLDRIDIHGQHWLQPQLAELYSKRIIR